MLHLIPLPSSLLGWLSPTTARLYDQLLPAQPEILAFGEKPNAAIPPVGSTISLYPGATRLELVKLLAVFLLFAVVRNNIASAASLRRLSIAALANGALLALFGLIQFFTSPHNTVYWTYETAGTVFGPFINRNHFAFYINMCIGLGVALLLSRYSGRRNQFARHHSSRSLRQARDWFRWSRRLLQDPQVLWISVTLSLMLSSVIFCLSRGAFVALLGGSMICLAIRLAHSRRFLRLEIVFLISGVALALVSWFGSDRVMARLATLWGGQALQDRLAIWGNALTVIRNFPIWGTGYGTYRDVELLYTNNRLDVEMLSVHAHNDYLELLTEGGLIGLALGMITIALVFRLSYRAVCRHAGHSAGGLALGALFGFTTVVLHSCVEFGLHIPAITLLATVLCAHLCALGTTDSNPSQIVEQRQGVGGASDQYSLRLWGMAPVLGASVAVVLGLVLAGEGWRAYRTQQFRLAAFDQSASLDADSGEQQITYQIEHLEAAAHLAPEYAGLQVELGEAHLDLFEERTARFEVSLEEIGTGSESVQAILASAPVGFPGAVTQLGPAVASPWLLATAVRLQLIKDEKKHLARQHLVPALRHFIQARNLCPIRAEPHMQIATYVDTLEKAELRTAYLARVKFVAPANPWLWYRCGTYELADQQPEQAWKSWRQSLKLSDEYLAEILNRSTEHLGPQDILHQVLPDRPGVLLAAASHLHPQPEATAERRRFLEKALGLLENQSGLWKADDLHIKAVIHQSLDQPAKALEAYQAALAYEPLQIGWRYELASLLHEQGLRDEARREVRFILGQQPGHGAARQLLDDVTHEIAVGR